MAVNDEIQWITPSEGKITYKTSTGKTKIIKVESVPKPIEFNGAWDVTFQPNLGAPEKETFNKLISWSDSSIEGIKYFSGTATYQKEFEVAQEFINTNHSFELDLGSVAVIAEVIINGKNAGILWKAPFRINADGFVKEGKNTLEVKITNLWPNRLIGDEHLPLDYKRKGNKIKALPDWLGNPTERTSKRTTFASWKHWKKDDELLTSGLLGPVKLNVLVRKEL